MGCLRSRASRPGHTGTTTAYRDPGSTAEDHGFDAQRILVVGHQEPIANRNEGVTDTGATRYRRCGWSASSSPPTCRRTSFPDTSLGGGHRPSNTQPSLRNLERLFWVVRSGHYGAAGTVPVIAKGKSASARVRRIGVYRSALTTRAEAVHRPRERQAVDGFSVQSLRGDRGIRLLYSPTLTFRVLFRFFVMERISFSSSGVNRPRDRRRIERLSAGSGIRSGSLAVSSRVG